MLSELKLLFCKDCKLLNFTLDLYFTLLKPALEFLTKFSYLCDTICSIMLVVLENFVLPMGQDSSHGTLKVTSDL